MNTACKEIITLEYRRNSIHYVIAGFLDVVGYHILKGNHILIDITSSCYKILPIRVFTGKLESYKMASVINTSTVNNACIVRLLLPSGRLYRGNISARFGRHSFLSYTSLRIAASSQGIKGTVKLVALCCKLACLEIRLIVVHSSVRLTLIGLYRFKRSALLGRSR